MTTYLDKETVLKYLTSEGDGKASDYMLPAEYVKTLLEHLEKGEFDATNSIGCEKKCYGNAEEFKALKNSIEEKDAEIARLKSRITELEKLTELQKGTIDAQGKATRANMAKELSAIIQQEWQCSLPEILYIIECAEKGKYGAFSKPAQKEPELFICPNVGKLIICSGCHHATPHEHTDACEVEGAWPCERQKCVSLKALRAVL
jgi:predicted RNase H-like nuclease (RuvC/YqgF family)